MKKLLSGCSVWLLGTALSLGTPQTVTSTDDSGPGTLRAAIAAAAAGDTISFALPTPATIILTSGELLLDKKLTIKGPGSDLLTVKRTSAEGTSDFGIFHIGAGDFAVTISGLTISNGSAMNFDTGPTSGGGLDNESSGRVTISKCVFKANQAYFDGGGVSNDSYSGALDLTDCLLTGNSTVKGDGGGLAATGQNQVTLLRCTVSSNISGYNGGGIHNGYGAMNITDSSVSDNLLPVDTSVASGAGIDNLGTLTILRCTIANNTNGKQSGGGLVSQGDLTVTNSTFFGNSAVDDGGAILVTGAATFSDCTITENTASDRYMEIGYPNGGGGICAYSSITLKNTIVAGNHSATTAPDISGNITSQGYNLVGDGTGIFNLMPAVGDQIGTSKAPIDPGLGTLANNGGPTETCALLPDSPAIDAGDPQAPKSDQRDYDRQDGAPDIGAFELGATIPRTLANISTRLFVGTGDNALIGGFIITGIHSKQVLLRGLGASLSLDGKLANPTLELHDDSGAVIGTNDDWQSNGNAQQIIDTGLPPPDPLESALLKTLDPGAYTVVLRGVGNGTGIALVEAYDLMQTTDSRMANISTRGLVQDADNVMIGGFIIGGSEAEDVLLRAIGPSLPIANSLADPVLELHNGDGTVLATNDNWRDSQEAEIEATGLPPPDDAESAIFMTLDPGNYTAVVRGVDSATGVALVEAYGLN